MNLTMLLSQQTLLKIVGGLLVTFFALFFWEHYARKTESQVKPSVYLGYGAELAQRCWEYVGYAAAKISSFYTYIDLKDLMDTFHDLFKPMIDFVTSPLWAAKGYIAEMNLYDHPYLVTLGSATIVGVLAWFVRWKWVWFEPFLGWLVTWVQSKLRSPATA